MNLGIWRLGYYQKAFIHHIDWFKLARHGSPMGPFRMAPHGSAWLRMAPHGHKVKTNTSSKFTAPSTNSSTAHMNHDWFSESRYLARYLDALATSCSIVVGWCFCPETLWYACLPLFVLYVVGIQLCLVALALYVLCCITCAASGILSRACRWGQFHHHQRSGSSSWSASQHVYEEATVPSEKKRIS